jgi:hypothetical protein
MEKILQKVKVISQYHSNVSVIAPYDFDNDGDGCFIGSRSVPGVYGLIQSICCWKMMEREL